MWTLLCLKSFRSSAYLIDVLPMYFCIRLTFSASVTGGSATYLLSIPKLRPAPPSVVNGDEATPEDEIVNTGIRGFQPVLVH